VPKLLSAHRKRWHTRGWVWGTPCAVRQQHVDLADVDGAVIWRRAGAGIVQAAETLMFSTVAMNGTEVVPSPCRRCAVRLCWEPRLKSHFKSHFKSRLKSRLSWRCQSLGLRVWFATDQGTLSRAWVAGQLGRRRRARGGSALRLPSDGRSLRTGFAGWPQCACRLVAERKPIA
jgi:hypothetical protein